MNYPLLSRLLGWVFMVLTLAFGSCLAVGWFYPGVVAEQQAIPGFMILTAACLLIGCILFFLARNAVPRIFRKEALAAVGAGWLLASLIGALPYYFLLEDCDFSSALFESCSGLSTTGATVFSNFEGWPRSLLFWRQLSQWIGGLGVVVLFVAILSLVGAGARMLFMQESHTDHSNLAFGSIRRGIYRLLGLYLLLSLFCFVAYRLAGMHWFDSLAHMMSTVSTAGFSTHPGSIGGYNNLAVELVAMFFMVICGMTFFVLLRVHRHPRELFQDTEIRVYCLLLLAGTAIGTVYLFLHDPNLTFAHCLRQVSFQIVSTMTTTGFNTADYSLWSAPLLSLILGCMVIGGCSGSTAGGIKVIRIILMFRICRNAIERAYRPKVYRPVFLKGKAVSQSNLDNLMTYLVLVILVLTLSFAMMSILQHGGISLEAQYSAVIACFFNIGPGLVEVGPSGNFAMITPPAKILLSILMIMGRLELFAVLVLFSPALWRRFR